MPYSTRTHARSHSSLALSEDNCRPSLIWLYTRSGQCGRWVYSDDEVISLHATHGEGKNRLVRDAYILVSSLFPSYTEIADHLLLAVVEK